VAESYRILDQRQAATSATVHYTVPAATQAIVKHVTAVNAHATLASTISFFVNGTAATNRWTQAVSLAPGESQVFDGTLALATGGTIYAQASVAAAITVTISGAEVS
jgi:hypothetical protein